jgi:hypothetical protein
VKRPILGLLAAVLFSYGFGFSPAQAAPSSADSAVVTPAHDGGHKHSSEDGAHQPSRHHDRGFHHDDGDDHDGDGHRRRRCEGLIVICLI